MALPILTTFTVSGRAPIGGSKVWPTAVLYDTAIGALISAPV